MSSKSYLLLIVLIATGQAQTGILASYSETCSVFAEPDRFVNQVVTIEAKVSRDTESKVLHAGMALRPPDRCGIEGRFWFQLPENERELGRGQLTKFVAIGKLLRVRDLNESNAGSGVAIDSDEIGAPLYSFKIETVLESERVCDNCGGVGVSPTFNYYFGLPFGNRTKYLVNLPPALPPAD